MLIRSSSVAELNEGSTWERESSSDPRKLMLTMSSSLLAMVGEGQKQDTGRRGVRSDAREQKAEE